MKIESVDTDKLIPYARNARTHSDAQVAQIAASIREFGFNNPVLIDEQSTIIAGHGRVLAALKLELSKVPCIRLSHLNDSQRKAYIIADNKLALNAGWDDELLKSELTNLQGAGVDLGIMGFGKDELRAILGVGSGESDELEYSKKINTPIYTPKGDKPEFAVMVDIAKYEALACKIKESTLSDEEKEFLLTAARRHIVFDYHQIAEYYCHASIEMQELMEDSALVIIDVEKAIENGYVVMSRQLEGIYFDAHGDDDEA